MSQYRRFSPEEKIQIVKEYLSGKSTFREIGQRLGYTCKNGFPGCFNRWLSLYRQHGETAFYKAKGNTSYSKEFKFMVVEELLGTGVSACELAAKYQISTADVLLRWVSLYNANRKLTDYCPKREVYMAEARRKTTIEERKEIVAYCIEHNRDYKGIAALYDVSYSQVYSWVKKYDDSDRGFQYTSRVFQKKLEDNEMIQSMSRVGHCIDNGPTEGFWGIIKSEMYQMYEITDEMSLRNAIKEYIRFYCDERPQSRSNCKTPTEVRSEALTSDTPIAYPIVRNKRIEKYKSKWCA